MHGGKREGAGRKTGAKQRADAEREAAIAATGSTPLAHMLEVMRSPDRSPEERMEAAKAAAPFVHPRLTAIEHKGPDGGPICIVPMTKEELREAVRSVVEKF